MRYAIKHKALDIVLGEGASEQSAWQDAVKVAEFGGIRELDKKISTAYHTKGGAI